MTQCPSSDQLKGLLTDWLSRCEAEDIEAHVETCASCQQALERLTGRADTLKIQGPTSSAEFGRDFLRRLEQQPPTSAWHSMDQDSEATAVPTLSDDARAEGSE